MNLFRKQNTNDILNENKAHKERTLGVFDLTLMSIGAVIGTGVMVLTGVVAATEAGPGVSLSFIISGIACIFIVLCYAEFSSTLPSSGGSYTYVYASMGEFLAYIVGLCIVLGYTLSVATVGAGWSAYFTNILSALGIIGTLSFLLDLLVFFLVLHQYSLLILVLTLLPLLLKKLKILKELYQ